MFLSKGIETNRFLSIEEHCRKYSPSFTLVQTMGAVCAFDQGHVYVDDNEKSAGCPKCVVTLPSKYTCFSFPTSSFLQLFFTVLTESFICQDQSATPTKHHRTETADYTS